MSLKKDEVLMRWHTWWGDRIGLVLRRSEKILRSLSVGNHVFTGGSAVQPQLSVMPMRALQAEYR